MPDGQFDILVIGGGVIGLSTAMHLLNRRPDLKVAVVEKDRELASQQTGHNSGVIHSGIYYKPGSFKAQFCVEGRRSMVQFCQENEIPFDPVGKVIVATEEPELDRLHALYERGAANGVPDLQVIGPEKLKEIEPHVVGLKALWAPHTGIVNFRDVCQAYARRIEDTGGTIYTSAAVQGIEQRDGANVVQTTRGDYEARHIVNCAGLHSDRVAAMTGINPSVRIIPFRGEYFTLRKASEHLVNGLIYPVPDPDLPFLGVHFTRNIKGYVEAGPNAVLATAREGYRKRDLNLRDFLGTLTFAGFWKMALHEWKTGMVEINRSFRRPVFLRDLQKMIPEITAKDLGTGGSGVRAQAVDRWGRLLDDFSIERSPNAIHVLNAPSPGATSSLVIGRYIVDMAEKTFALGERASSRSG